MRRKEEAVDFNQMQKSVDVSQQACTNASAMSRAACSTLKPPPFPSLPLSVFLTSLSLLNLFLSASPDSSFSPLPPHSSLPYQQPVIHTE